MPVGAAGVDDGMRRVQQSLIQHTQQRKVTFSALLQILSNIRANPEDPRFRRIRTQNERFHADVGKHDGALQILLSSGFQMQVEDQETVLVMMEPDLASETDRWTAWYDQLKDTIVKLQEASDARSRVHHGGLMT